MYQYSMHYATGNNNADAFLLLLTNLLTPTRFVLFA